MDRNLHRPIPTMQCFRRFTTLFSPNNLEDEDTYSIGDDLPDFVPSTQTINETISTDFTPTIEGENEGFTSTPHEHSTNVFPTTEDHPSSNQSNCQDHPRFVSQTQRGRTRWSISDTGILIEEKRIEKDALSNGGVMKKTTTSIEKWKIVQDYCSRHGVIRTVNQCRDRWEHVLPDYKKVRDYEAHILSGHDSYWNMTSKERLEKKLPSNFPNELMVAMDVNFGNDRAFDPGNICIDTSENENAPVNEADTENTFQDSTNIDNETERGYTGKKRKPAFKMSGMKDTILENNKMVVSTLQTAEGLMKRHEKEYALMERRLNKEEINDEKMIKLEEQKVNVQMNLVAALNSIGKTMLKISESFSNEK